MNVFWTLSAAFLLVLLDSTLGLHKCSPEVEKKIKDLWAKEGKPTNLVKQAVEAGKQNVIKTSKSYYPDGTSCSFTNFAADGKSLTLTKIVNGEKEDEHEDIEEDDGVVIEKKTKVKRYHVFSKGGVAAWYKCGDGQDAKEGCPEGAVKVKNGIEYSQEDVDTAASRLKCIGVELTESYSSIC